jgi:hypothetical protein
LRKATCKPSDQDRPGGRVHGLRRTLAKATAAAGF